MRIAVIRLLRRPALFALGFLLLLLPAAIAKFASYGRSTEKSLNVVRSYLRAAHERDYVEAYRFISSADRVLWKQKDYVEAQGALGGFALQLAKELNDDMKIWVVSQDTKNDRARYTVGYRLPAADELRPLLLDWDASRLNALSGTEQSELLAAVDKLKKNGKLIFIEGQETVNLIRDDGGWKIFFDWASGVKVSFNAALPANSAIDVRIFNRELFVSRDEPFQIYLKVKNRGPRQVVARIDHLIEPEDLADRISLIACGFLTPLALQPGEQQEISSAYLLDSAFPKNSPLTVSYRFNLETEPAPGSLRNKTSRTGD
jgi:Cytochrome c oxidase assembly protein CtaG/Cox11